MSPKYRRLLLAGGAIATILIVRYTGLDQGLIDELFQALADALIDEAPADAE